MHACFCMHCYSVGVVPPGHFHGKWEWIPTLLNATIKSSLPITRPPSLPPLCLFIHARNVNSYRAVKTLSLCLAVSPVTSNSEPTASPTATFSLSDLSVSGWGSRSSILKLWMDVWAAGFSGSCCPGLGPVIGSAWLINRGHCRWTPFSKDKTLPLSQHFISPPFPRMDHISLCIEARPDKIKMLLYLSLPFHCLNFSRRFSVSAFSSWPAIFL